jgi:hypothetical protein
MLFKNTTKHEKRFPFAGGKRDEIVFPAGAVVEVSDSEAEALSNSRVASAWIASGELAPFTPKAEAAKPSAGDLSETGGAELSEKTEPKA